MKLLIASVIAVAGLGYCSQSKADCFIHSNIKMTRQNIIAGPTDVQRMVMPVNAGKQCTVNYRVYIGDRWRTAEGTATANTESEACVRAMDIGRGTVLAEVEPNKITAETNMVCSDVEPIRVHPVRIGDIVWESETDMSAHPEERKYFTYKFTQCRYFAERNAKDQNLLIYQGVICRIDTTPGSKWRVIDKY